MKKVFFLFAVTTLFACGGNKPNETAEAQKSDSVAIATESASEDDYELQATENPEPEEFALAQEFLSEVINDLQVNEEWVVAHCSESVCQRLKADNPYDGDGFAVWELQGRVFESEIQNDEAQVVGFGYGLLRGTPVYTVEKMYNSGDITLFATMYYGMERKGDDFIITFFDLKPPSAAEE